MSETEKIVRNIRARFFIGLCPLSFMNKPYLCSDKYLTEEDYDKDLCDGELP